MMKLRKYKEWATTKRQWIDKVPSEELSIWDQEMSTNNGAENYHGRLKSIIKTNKPRIWNFLDTMYGIILDTDNEFARLHRGLTITRALKKTSILTQQHRNKCKERLVDGIYNPLHYVQAISHTILSFSNANLEHHSSDEEGEMTDTEEPVMDTPISNSLCAVCLMPRQSTWIFMPCKHATCCGDCWTTIQELGQSCPICRSDIGHAFRYSLLNLLDIFIQ